MKYHRSGRFLTHPVRPLAFQAQHIGVQPGTVFGGEFGWGGTSVKEQRRCPKVGSGRTEIRRRTKGQKRARSEPPVRATTAKARPINSFERRLECGARGVRQVTSGVTDFLWLYDFFNAQNIEHGYINVLFNYVNVMGYNRSLKIKKNQFYMGNIDLDVIHQCCAAYITFLTHSCASLCS